MIEIQALNKRQLLEYIADKQFGLSDHIAISKHRARSQAVNPRCEKEDIILLLAIEKEILMGYLGVLPDHLFTPTEKCKVGWFSCLWVSPKARGKSISLQLMETALKYWDHKILSADYVPFTKKIYDKTKAFGKEPFTKSGIRLYLRSDLYNLLPPKAKFFKQIKGVLKIKDAFFNIFLNLKLKFFSTNIHQYNIEHLDKIDTALDDFLSKTNHQFGFKRTSKELNWMISNPWILDKSKEDGLSEKYHFSSVANDFHFKPILVRDEHNNPIALLIFAKRDGSLKLPYIYYHDNIDAVTDIVNHVLIHWKIKTFTSFHPVLCEALKHKSTPAFYRKNQTRSYMVSTILESAIFDKNTFVQDGDGDCCFT